MIPIDDGAQTVEFESFFVIKPSFPWWSLERFSQINKVVILIDEYDAPIIQHVGEDIEMAKNICVRAKRSIYSEWNLTQK
jgi:hypothetical protein